MSRPSEPGGVLAIDFGGTKVAVTADGRRIEAECFDRGSGPVEVLQLAVELTQRLGRDQPEVVSIATPGAIVEGRALFAPNVAGWDEINLAAWGRSTYDSLVVVSNDVEAAAAGESLTGALRGVGTGLYVNVGTGIAAAVVVDGRVLHGTNGLAGEIGYGRTGAAEAIDWATETAPLEQLAGGVGLRAAGIRIPAEADLAWLDSPAGIGTRNALDELARHLLTCVLLIDPSVVVVGGGLARVPVVVAHVRRRLDAAALAKVSVVGSAFGSHASVLGALALGQQKLEEQG